MFESLDWKFSSSNLWIGGVSSLNLALTVANHFKITGLTVESGLNEIDSAFIEHKADVNVYDSKERTA